MNAKGTKFANQEKYRRRASAVILFECFAIFALDLLIRSEPPRRLRASAF